MTYDSTRPPQLSYGRGETLFLVVASITVAVALLDLAGGLASALAHHRFRLVSASKMGRVVVELVRDARDPATAFAGPGVGPFPPTLFWGMSGALVVCLAVAIHLACHRGRAQRTVEGFATRAEVERVASLCAARRHAAQTRPGLYEALPSILGHRPLRRLGASDVGYRLGTTRHPHGVDLVASFETSLRLVAPPGEGKTTRVMEPIGRTHPGPVFATSTKTDLYEGLSVARATRGPVFVLDPDGLAQGAALVRWSPVVGCEDTRTAERRAAALVAAGTETGDVRGGEFFRSSAKTVLATLLRAAALGERTMVDVLRWAADPQNTEPARLLARHGGSAVAWDERLARHTTGSEVTTSGVMRTVDLALSCFQHDDVLEQCSPSVDEAFDFEAFLKGNGTIFAIGKDRPGGVGPLITTFAEELLYAAEKYALRQPRRRVDPPLMFLLDEAPSIAPLPSLPTLLADGRGRGFVTVYAMQSFSQAEARWGREGAETLANSTTVTAVLGGLKVAEDLRELSRLCGSHRVLRHTSSEDGRYYGQSISATWVEEPVLEESAIRTLDEGVALIVWARLRPVLAYLPAVWEQRGAKAPARGAATTRAAIDSSRAAAGTR